MKDFNITKYRKLTYEEIQSRRPQQEQVLKTPPQPIAVVLDNIRSLYNVGAIFRTADGVHLEKLYLCGITGTPSRNEIRKTSLGAEEVVPWVYKKDTMQAIEELREKGYQIVVLEHTDASVDYRRAAYRFPLCLVVGHEFHGIQDKVVEAADLAIEIPMHGVKQSLNVSVAFGIAIYQIMSCREDK